MRKRLFDIIFSVGAMLFFFPLALLIAIAIKASSKGPIFYSSSRMGKDASEIFCWKFRTMCHNADDKLGALLQDPQAKLEWETHYKLKHDPRVTPLGRWLRKTSLDELPQFWNVLKGDMSVVGPRPVTRDEIEKYFGPKAQKIFSIRPGLTGMWQTSGRSLLTYEERIQLEENYVNHHSFILDLQIILKTIPHIFCAKGAF